MHLKFFLNVSGCFCKVVWRLKVKILFRCRFTFGFVPKPLLKGDAFVQKCNFYQCGKRICELCFGIWQGCLFRQKNRKVTISFVFNTFSFLIVGEDDEYFGFVRKSRSGNLRMSFCPFIRALNLNLAQVFKLLS